MKKLHILFSFILLSVIGFGQLSVTAATVTTTPGQKNVSGETHGPLNVPVLTGATSVCFNSTGNVYTTDAGHTNYVWNVVGGSITSGGTLSSSTATVTWNTVGTQSISVFYSGSSTTLLPVVVNPLTASISISASATTVAAGTPVSFTATPANGGTTPAYQWKVNGANAGTNSPTYTYTPVNGDAVYCILTSNAPCVSSLFTSNLIPMTVTTSPLLVTVSTKTAVPGQIVYFPVKLKGATTTPISSANIQISYNPAVLTYDTLINFYSGTPSGQWFFSGNSNTVSANWIEPSLLTLSIPDSTTLFEIKFTYIGGIASLPFITYEFTDAQYNFISTSKVDGAISPTPPSLTGPTSVCQSAGNVYTTDAAHSAYVWNVTGGTITAGGTSSSNTATVTWTTSGSENISVSYAGTTTTTLPVTVNSSPVASVSIAASSNPVCANATVTFTATPVNGGITPVYQWKKNGVNVGTNSTSYAYAPANGDIITCVLTSSETCISGNPATSGGITMTVNPLTASVTIAATSTSVYAGTPVTYTATPVNGGSSPAYQWKVNGANAGTNSPVFTYTPVNGDAVYCILTSNAPCVSSLFTSNLISMTVTTRPLQVTISTLTATPGSIVYFPVKLKGASAAGTPITAASIEVSYDPSVLTYDTIVNFYSGTPSAQWIFSGNNNKVAANWIEPTLSTIAIADSATLFEIKFTYIGGTTTLPFTVNDFTDAQYNLVTTTHVDGGISPATPPTKTLTLSGIKLEGFYNGLANPMNPAQDENGNHWGAGIADHIAIELHNASSYSTIEYTATDAALGTNGAVVVNIPAIYSAAYYIAIKHRNSIETVSATPVSFAGSTITRSFATPDDVFGGNLVSFFDGGYAIYGGDVYQDGIIDGSDMAPVDNQAAAFAAGYIVEDCNGDGIIDGTDMAIIDNNAAAFVGSVTP